MRYLLAIWFGKFVKLMLRLIGRGGTALPGLITVFVFKDVLKEFSRKLKFGSVVVTGTNGKTTTSRLLCNILERHGYAVINNRAGSNLERGLVSMFLDVVDLQGRVYADVAVLEVDEAELPNVIGNIYCQEMIVTNFFRDQLDRYGELNALRDLVAKAIREMSAGSKVILNADDPLVCSLKDVVPEGVELKYFGLNYDFSLNFDYAADTRNCVKCRKELSYNKIYLSHLGNYFCTNCGFKRPSLDLSSKNIEIKGVDGSSFDLLFADGEYWQTEIMLPGIFNVYNVMAAVLASKHFEVNMDLVIESLLKFQPVFGRFEKILVGNKEIYLMLSKNPTGFNELLRTILFNGEKLNLLFVLNDNYADGRDISWIWDVDFENLAGKLNWLALSGTRAEEMKMRMKYAGVNMDLVGVQKNYKMLLEDVVNAGSGGKVYILCSYTGMLDIRKQMNKNGWVKNFWND